MAVPLDAQACKEAPIFSCIHSGESKDNTIHFLGHLNCVRYFIVFKSERLKFYRPFCINPSQNVQSFVSDLQSKSHLREVQARLLLSLDFLDFN